MLETSIREMGGVAQLSGAILMYSGQEVEYNGGYPSGSAVAHCTVHKVAQIKGRPEIMPGRLMTQADLQTLVGSLVAAEQSLLNAQWIEDCILAKGRDRTIWWTPPGKRSMFFAYTANPAKAFEGHAVCPVPGLVWIATGSNAGGQGSLYVYAYKGKDRPSKATQLYQAPFFNVWSQGRVCIGSAQLPSSEQNGSTDAWERTFFGSRFTHPNFTAKDRLTHGIDPVSFWKGQVAKPAAAFPEKRLVQMPLVVDDLLDSMLFDRLAKLPKAQGEF